MCFGEGHVKETPASDLIILHCHQMSTYESIANDPITKLQLHEILHHYIAISYTRYATTTRDLYNKRELMCGIGWPQSVVHPCTAT